MGSAIDALLERLRSLLRGSRRRDRLHLPTNVSPSDVSDRMRPSRSMLDGDGYRAETGAIDPESSASRDPPA